MKQSISAFFPAYNEWATLGSMIAATSHILKELKIDHELIIIDNGSTDYSDIVFAELKQKYKTLRVVRLNPNQGYGGALKAGFKNAKKDIIFYTDADAQYDIMELKNAISELKPNIDVVTGYKSNRVDPIYRYVLGKIYQSFVRFMFGLKTKDADCDFRLIRKHVMKDIKLESSSGIICVELMKKIENRNARIKQIPIRHFARAFGKSQFFNIKQVLKTLLSLVKLWWKLY